IGFSGEIARKIDIELLADRRMAVFERKPPETVPGGERGERIPDNRETVEALRQNLEQCCKCDRMLDREREILRERFIDFNAPVFSLSRAFAFAIYRRRIVA